MKRREMFSKLREAASKKGGKLAREAGEKLISHVSDRAMRKGLIDEPVDYDEAMRRLKTLAKERRLDKDQVNHFKELIKKRFKGGK